MPTFKTGKALAAHQRKRAQKVRRSLQIEAEALVEQQRQTALRLTSGNVSTRELHRMGHPFSRRHPGGLSRLPINRQKGTLQTSLRVFRRKSGRGMVWQLQFTARHARFVLAQGGTRPMLARGFWTEMVKQYQRDKKRLEAALKRAHE